MVYEDVPLSYICISARIVNSYFTCFILNSADKSRSFTAKLRDKFKKNKSTENIHRASGKFKDLRGKFKYSVNNIPPCFCDSFYVFLCFFCLHGVKPTLTVAFIFSDMQNVPNFEMYFQILHDSKNQGIT